MRNRAAIAFLGTRLLLAGLVVLPSAPLSPAMAAEPGFATAPDAADRPPDAWPKKLMSEMPGK